MMSPELAPEVSRKQVAIGHKPCLHDPDHKERLIRTRAGWLIPVVASFQMLPDRMPRLHCIFRVYQKQWNLSGPGCLDRRSRNMSKVLPRP